MSSDKFTGFKLHKSQDNESIYIFTFGETFVDKEFLEFLGLLDKLLGLRNPFCMLIDTSRCHHIPIKTTVLLVQWMKKHKKEIPGILLGSSAVIRSKIVAGLINQAFKIQKPSSPNKLTTSYEEAYKFLDNIIEKQ
jgi:hypothetical protein